MFTTLTILSGLSSCLDATTLNHLKTIVTAMLTMTGRVTMLGISRWADEGGSYRTIQRFFNSEITWDNMNWNLIYHYFLDANNTYILAADETYKLRFQIEFNFRGAKQYWGLEDFMNVNEIPVTNAANLAFFMVNISHALILNIQKDNPQFSIQDLKAHFRGTKYVNETLKLLPQKPDIILIQQIFARITKIGGINTG